MDGLGRPMRRLCVGVLALGALASGGCAPADPGQGTDVGEPRTLGVPAPDMDGVVRVLVYHDMEGLTGQSDPNTFRFTHPERYALGRTYLTGDVNAVVAGLFEGGAGSGGFASHTYTLGIDFVLNGMSVTETEIVGYSWGRVGVPVIFASGDDRLAADLAGPMPWVEFVTVKTATSASSAVPRPVEEARSDLTAGAARAMRDYQQARVIRLAEPVTAQLHAVPPANLAMLSAVPDIDYADQRVTFEASGFRAAYDGLVALVTVARGGYSSVMSETGRAMAGPAFATRMLSSTDGSTTNPDAGPFLKRRLQPHAPITDSADPTASAPPGQRNRDLPRRMGE